MPYHAQGLSREQENIFRTAICTGIISHWDIGRSFQDGMVHSDWGGGR